MTYHDSTIIFDDVVHFIYDSVNKHLRKWELNIWCI